jgi:hypothetical protein
LIFWAEVGGAKIVDWGWLAAVSASSEPQTRILGIKITVFVPLPAIFVGRGTELAMGVALLEGVVDRLVS